MTDHTHVSSQKPASHHLSSMILGICVCTVVLWEIGIMLARQSEATPSLDPSRYNDFRFSWNGVTAQRLPLQAEPGEANLLVLGIEALDANNPGLPQQAAIRLVHGYNMRDCMRIKGYEVELISVLTSNQPVEVWSLTSPSGARSIWVTALLRADDYSFVHHSVTELAFPRVGTPDDLTWEFQGLTRNSVKQPVQNLGHLIQSKWNAARSDLFTFLKIRRPARPSSALLTVAVLTDIAESSEVSDVQTQLKLILNTFVEDLRRHSAQMGASQAALTLPP